MTCKCLKLLRSSPRVLSSYNTFTIIVNNSIAIFIVLNFVCVNINDIYKLHYKSRLLDLPSMLVISWNDLLNRSLTRTQNEIIYINVNINCMKNIYFEAGISMTKLIVNQLFRVFIRIDYMQSIFAILKYILYNQYTLLDKNWERVSCLICVG